jgi:hypothetical protein
MSSRTRQSTVRATPSRSRPSAAPTPSRGARDDLPPYRKPSHPLDHESQRQLRELKGSRLTSDIKNHNKNALETVRATAESVNDMLSEHTRYFEARSKKWDAGKRLDEKEEEEKIMKELQERVDGATVKLEESMRAIIDSSVVVQRMDDTLDWLQAHAPAQLEAQYTTQLTQRHTQSQSQRRRTQNADSDMDEEMDDGPTPGPTPLDGSRVALTGTNEMYNDRMERRKNEYTSMSLTARYAKHNDYRDFKRVVHDAKYGDDGPVLGHEDTWFTETGSPAPGITNTQRGDFDDDDDIVMDKATVSTRCPITFQQFKEPVTSTRCPHTFEKQAILDMIRLSSNRMGGGANRTAGEKAVSCPVAGCDQVRDWKCCVYTPTNLVLDAVSKRTAHRSDSCPKDPAHAAGRSRRGRTELWGRG